MTVKTFDVEGCTTGVALTTGNQGASGTVVTPVVTGGGTIQATTTSPIRGTKSLIFNGATTGDTALVLWTEAGSPTAAGQRAEFYFPSAPTVDTAVMVFYGSGGACAQVQLRTTGRITITNSPGTGIYVTPNDSTGILTFPVTVTIDCTIDVGGSTVLGRAKMDIYKNATSMSVPWISMAEMTGQNFYRTGVIVSERIGKQTSTGVWTGLLADSWKTVDSYGLLGTVTVPVNLPPVVTPPADQSIASGTAASLTMTATDPEAAAMTYTWVNTSRPAGASAPTMTGTTTVTASTGTLTTPGVYTFTPSASDGTSTTVGAVTTVYVYDSTGACIGKSLRANTYTGTLAMINATSAVDYLESSVAPAGQVVVEDMNPIKPGDLVFSVGGYRSPNPGANCNLQVEILNGPSDTVITTRIFALTVTDADYPVTLTGAENAAFTNYNIWAVRYTATQV